jgi:predicted Rossmann fold flavoprotein
MSRLLVPLIKAGNQIVLHLDMKPALDTKKLDNRLIRDLNSFDTKPLKMLLRGLIPGKMIHYCLSETRLRSDKACNKISADEKNTIISWLKNQKFEISGYASVHQAIITMGGIEISEINPKTMESKLIKGLFFAGELIDIDADTGGFNLQIAFSTGWVAGG